MNAVGMLLGASYGIIANSFGWDYAVLICVISFVLLSLFIHFK
jgi:hypothetical protein